MFKKMRNRGFTLIELVMVIVVLAILAVVAIPRFFDLSGEAENAAEMGVVGAVRAGIVTYQADALAGGAPAPGFPPALENPALGTGIACSAANPCFTAVLGLGGVTQGWTTGAVANDYDNDDTGTTWTYDPAAGTFE